MDVLMPQLGETVSEGKVTTWFKAVGDPVKAGDTLFEIETDKVTMEIEAIDAGVLLEVRVPVGAVAAVGAVIAVIGEGSTTAPASHPPAADKPAPAVQAAATLPTSPAAPSPRKTAPFKLDPYFEVRTPPVNYGPAKAEGREAATPLARRRAATAGIGLSRVTGSGPRGRIVAADIERAAKAPAPPAPGAAATPDGIAALYDLPFVEVPLDGMRRAIAARLQHAKQTVPHFYIVNDVAVDALLRLREEVNAAAPRGNDDEPAYKVSLNDFIIKAWAAALLAVPAANAVWAGDRILRFGRADIAVAVAIEGGLITPVVRAAETKSVRAISAEMGDLASRARKRKLLPSEYRGGSSAISNLGMYGVREFSAILSPPHATILAVGGARREAVERPDGTVAFAGVMTVTLSADHRVVDGSTGAELLGAFKAAIEKPIRLLA